MAIQFLPIIKALAPYIAQVATAAIPAFTAKKKLSTADVAEADTIVTQQIEELQAAASQNAQSVQVLAENLQQAIQNIEATAREADKKIAFYKLIIYVSFSLSVISVSTCVYLLIANS